MEPMIPSSKIHLLENLTHELTVKASSLTSRLPESVCRSLGQLIRSMNCYYSNLIEGHNTHPYDIEQALKENYSTDQKKRNLQLEARSHIALQELIDSDKSPKPILSTEYLKWSHLEFCSRLPEEMLIVENPTTKEQATVIPGEFRRQEVIVGQHVPPSWHSLDKFLGRLYEAYSENHLSKPKQIIAIAAAHHRLLWVHPFFRWKWKSRKTIFTCSVARSWHWLQPLVHI